uniref:EF-hand domain-containing protein n=1 Tax=Suricata suricatta TaxID=37032 RepID=A0A673UMB6_SURSU
MTKLEDHLEGVIDVFHQYSAQEGHQDTLSKGEMKKLMMRELPNSLKIFQDLDADKNGQVTFEEFVVLVSRVLQTAHENIHKE